jgi:hypothetical protein
MGLRGKPMKAINLTYVTDEEYNLLNGLIGCPVVGIISYRSISTYIEPIVVCVYLEEPRRMVKFSACERELQMSSIPSHKLPFKREDFGKVLDFSTHGDYNGHGHYEIVLKIDMEKAKLIIRVSQHEDTADVELERK